VTSFPHQIERALQTSFVAAAAARISSS